MIVSAVRQPHFTCKSVISVLLYTITKETDRSSLQVCRAPSLMELMPITHGVDGRHQSC